MNGFVFLDKQQGLSSFAAAASVRRLFGEKKAGHTGTLDPMATGLLTVALGEASRFIELIPSTDKSYRATLLLGTVTDTLDITGRVLEENSVSVDEERIFSVLGEFKGEIMQTPPMYSAIKHGGVKLYELARRGATVERKQRRVSIYSIAPVCIRGNEVTFDVSCSSGTYIRSLIDDIGRRLGCGAVMTALRRTAAHGVGIESALTLDGLCALKAEGGLDSALCPIDRMLGYERLFVTDAQARRFVNGGELDVGRTGASRNGFLCLYSPGGAFLGVGLCDMENGSIYPKKVLPSAQAALCRREDA